MLEMKVNGVKFSVFQDGMLEYRWHAKRNGRIVATSGESFAKEGNAERAMKAFLKALEHDAK